MRLILPALLSIAIAACTPASPDHEPMDASPVQPATLTDAEARQRTSDYVYEPYTRDQFPKLFAQLGAAVDRIQPVREGAALAALRSGRCDRVELSEIATQTSAEDLRAFVDCSNGERFYFTESQLAAEAPAVAQSDRTIGRADAIQACAEAARAVAMYPSLLDAHTWAGASFDANKTTGGARVLLDFEAANALGAKLPYRADCLFPAGQGTPELTVHSR